MRIVGKILLTAAMAVSATPALAQEMIVTGSRQSGVVDSISAEDIGAFPDTNYAEGLRRIPGVAMATSVPARVLTLRRTADFAIQVVLVTGDTREQERRRAEILDMVKGAIGLSGKYGVELATGQLVVEPLTAGNYRNLPIMRQGGREDAEQVMFLVKTPLTPDVDAKTALDRISKFIAAVPTVGRAEMKASSGLTLSVVNPEQYRGTIIELIAKDAASTSAHFGSGYGVAIQGFDQPVQWSRASLTEVSLYLPVSYAVLPKQ